MNPAAILALIADLYERVGVLTEENRQLREDTEILKKVRDKLVEAKRQIIHEQS